MPEWLFILVLVLAALAGTFWLSESMARRYALAVRGRMEPLTGGGERDDGDPFDQDERAEG